MISFFSISRLVSEFEHPGLLNLTHVAVDRGSIYLAGGNVLYQLDQVIYIYYCKDECDKCKCDHIGHGHVSTTT